MSHALDPEAEAIRAEYIYRITGGVRPQEITSDAEVRELIEALVVVAAVTFLKRRRLPCDPESAAIFARAAIDAMERRAAVGNN